MKDNYNKEIVSKIPDHLYGHRIRDNPYIVILELLKTHMRRKTVFGKRKCPDEIEELYTKTKKIINKHISSKVCDEDIVYYVVLNYITPPAMSEMKYW